MAPRPAGQSNLSAERARSSLTSEQVANCSLCESGKYKTHFSNEWVANGMRKKLEEAAGMKVYDNPGSYGLYSCGLYSCDLYGYCLEEAAGIKVYGQPSYGCGDEGL